VLSVKRLAVLLAALVVAVVPVLVAPPATSADFLWKATITFDKNPQHQFDSRVVWRLFQRQGGAWKLVETKAWRAGSGLPGRNGQNSCAWSRGWLPNGVYHLRQSDHYRGNVIHGRVFRLDNKNCGNGNVRHDLFLHSEQTVGNGQCKDRRGDQNCRWEFPRINDYKSLGCIKMAPQDLAQLTYLFHRHFAAGVRYPTDRVSLVVTS
jgi:hypothetical protein